MRGHGSPDQALPPRARSVSPGPSSLTRRSLQVLTAGIACRSTSLRADVLDMRRWSAAYGTSMRPSGRSSASTAGATAGPRIYALGILAAFGIAIRYSRRFAWHLEDVVFHGMAFHPLALHLVGLSRNEVQGISSCC